MPQQKVMENASYIAMNTELLNHLIDAGKVLGPFVVVIISLLVWAWNRMEKTQDKLETTVVNHIKENDGVHDQIFNRMRETEEKLNHLLGEHETQHGK